MSSWFFVEALTLIGAFFCLSASIGVYRLQSTLARLHAASKSISLGVSCIIIAAVIANLSTASVVKGIVTLLFLLATIPIASHLIALTFLSSYPSAKSIIKKEALKLKAKTLK